MNKQSLLALLTISSIVLTSCGNSSTTETLSSTSTTEATTVETSASTIEEDTENSESSEEIETIESTISTTEEENTETTSESESELNTIETEEIISEINEITFTVTPMTATLYAVKNCNIRKGPDSKAYEIIGTLNSGDAVEVTGKVDGLNWYEISLAGGKAYVSASLLQSTQPVQQPASSSSTPSSSSSTATTTPSTPSQSSTPSTPSSSSDNPIVYKDETITCYANGDAVVGGVLYKQGEYVPGYGIDGGDNPGR